LLFNTKTNMHKPSINKQAIHLAIAFLLTYTANTQTVSTPYSIVGVGDVETRSNDKYSGMASASTALASPYFFNTTNPAALAAMPKHFVLFEVEGKGRRSTFTNLSTDSTASSSSDFAVKRLALAFKATNRFAFSFGLKPYSSVNYSFSSVAYLSSQSDAYLRTVDGSGGLQQAYFGNAIQLTKNFSLGYNVSYLFGSLNQQVNYYSPTLDLDVTKNNNSYLHNVLFQVGAQYHSKADNNFQQHVGATVTFPTLLTQENSYIVQEGTTDATAEQKTGTTKFQVPLKASFGYGVTINKKLTISADYNFQNWRSSVASISGTNIGSAYRTALGGEYVFSKSNGFVTYEKYYLQSGIFYEKNYWKVGTHQLEDYGFTLGGGVNIGRLNFFGAYELGQRGKLSLKQIPEKYSQITLGITFKDLWEKSKFSRYD
jgi:hypothetical protein